MEDDRRLGIEQTMNEACYASVLNLRFGYIDMEINEDSGMSRIIFESAEYKK